jgi:hypothetical protein
MSAKAFAGKGIHDVGEFVPTDVSRALSFPTVSNNISNSAWAQGDT